MNAAAPQSAASAASPLFPQRCSPSWDQQEAIATLSNQDIDDVFAYIRYAKSFEGVFARKDGFHSVGGGLSVEQVHAIETLSGCADRKLRTWLRTARDSGGPEPFRSFRSNSPYASEVTQSLDPSTAAGRSDELEPPFTNSTLPWQEAGDIKEPPLYHCTICKEPRSYKNDSDWKKHEKEHEYTYICTPDGWIGSTSFGTKCVICGVIEPGEQHAFVHNTAQTCQYSCKRRDHMTKHLNKCHGVFDSAQASTLANAWRRDSGRRFWSCGLCVCDKPFTSLQDRLMHIDHEHFRKHQSIEDWDATKVILGLLRQPDVSGVWGAHMTIHHGWEHPEVVWVRSDLGDLQLRLEMGPSDKQSAVTLAKAAYNVCVIRPSDAWNGASGSSGNHDGSTAIPHMLSTYQHRLASYDLTPAQTLALEPFDWDTLHTPTLGGAAAANSNVADATFCQSVSDDAGSQHSTDPFLFQNTGNDAYIDSEQW